MSTSCNAIPCAVSNFESLRRNLRRMKETWRIQPYRSRRTSLPCEPITRPTDRPLGDDRERAVEPDCDDRGGAGGHGRRAGLPLGAGERAHSHLCGRRQSDLLPERSCRPAGGQRIGGSGGRAVRAPPPVTLSECCKWRLAIGGRCLRPSPFGSGLVALRARVVQVSKGGFFQLQHCRRQPGGYSWLIKFGIDLIFLVQYQC